MKKMVATFGAGALALALTAGCSSEGDADKAEEGADPTAGATLVAPDTTVAPTTTSVPVTTTALAPTTTSVPVTTTTVAPTSTSLALPVEVGVTADLPYTSQQKLDVYAPTRGSEWPVVDCHGGNPAQDPDRRKRAEPEARAIAGHGVVVYVPTWNGMGPAGGSEESICAY